MNSQTDPRDANGHAIPAWAIEVLATPGDKRRLHRGEDGIVADNGERIEVEDGIVDLSGHSTQEVQQHSQAFFVASADAVEFLKPRQQRFRQLLRRFARGLRPGATVADIAAADSEFVSFYPTRRVLAMDLSTARLRRGIELGRVDFAVLADIHRPPLLDCAVDAIVSSNTLHHLPADDVPQIVEGLLGCVKPGGRLAVTLTPATVPTVIERIGQERVVECVCLEGPVSRWWQRVIYPRGTKVIKRLGERAARATKPLMDFVSSSIAIGEGLIKPSASGESVSYWLVLKAP